MHFDNSITNRIPLPKNIEQAPFIAQADLLVSLHTDLQGLEAKFQRSLLRELGLSALSTKLQAWHGLSFADFLRELEKLKVKLSLSQKTEWEEYFGTEQAKAAALVQRIRQTDHAVDSMVYALYDLTAEEIAIVEGQAL